MKRSVAILFSLFVFASVISLASCGGGSSNTLPITVQMSSAALALDVNQSAPVTATAINAPTNQGFDWALSCGGGNCGTITVHTASGAPATYTAPAAPLSIAVTITAKLTGLTNSGTASVNSFWTADSRNVWTNCAGESQHSIQPATCGKRRCWRPHLGAKWRHILTGYSRSQSNGNDYRHSHRNQPVRSISKFM